MPSPGGRFISFFVEILIESLLPWKAAAVGLWLAGFFLLERLRPAASYPKSDDAAPPWRRVLRNATLWGINSALSPRNAIKATSERVT